MTYIGLAEWLAENLRRYAEQHLREKLLVFATVFRSDAVLAPMLLARVDSRRVWDDLWVTCLQPRLEVIVTGCQENDDGSCDGFDEAMRCIDERLGVVIDEITPWRTLDEFVEKSTRTLKKLYKGEGNDTEADTER